MGSSISRYHLSRQFPCLQGQKGDYHQRGTFSLATIKPEPFGEELCSRKKILRNRKLLVSFAVAIKLTDLKAKFENESA